MALGFRLARGVAAHQVGRCQRQPPAGASGHEGRQACSLRQAGAKLEKVIGLDALNVGIDLIEEQCSIMFFH